MQNLIISLLITFSFFSYSYEVVSQCDPQGVWEVKYKSTKKAKCSDESKVSPKTLLVVTLEKDGTITLIDSKNNMSLEKGILLKSECKAEFEKTTVCAGEECNLPGEQEEGTSDKFVLEFKKKKILGSYEHSEWWETHGDENDTGNCQNKYSITGKNIGHFSWMYREESFQVPARGSLPIKIDIPNNILGVELIIQGDENNKVEWWLADELNYLKWKAKETSKGIAGSDNKAVSKVSKYINISKGNYYLLLSNMNSILLSSKIKVSVILVVQEGKGKTKQDPDDSPGM